MPGFTMVRKLPARGKETMSITPYQEASGVKMVRITAVVRFGDTTPVESNIFLKASMFQNIAQRYLDSLTTKQVGEKE